MDRAISYPKEVVKFGILDHYDSLMKAKAKEKKKKKKWPGPKNFSEQEKREERQQNTGKERSKRALVS